MLISFEADGQVCSIIINLMCSEDPKKNLHFNFVARQ